MLWPLVLPVKITFSLLAVLVTLLTVFRPVRKWNRGKTFVVALLSAGLLLVPSCIGIMGIVDGLRFGTFQYASFSDVNDFRVERYLPTKASDITLNKSSMGHLAKYSISESDLKDYVDQLWKNWGEHSAISRDDLQKQRSETPSALEAIRSNFELAFRRLRWPAPASLIELHSPVEPDGGGAVYFYDPMTQTGYHKAGYW
ncbi:hypothetical protein [Planctomicrobium piriforme]|uniref:Uncharacterized protein n=1 Tax=Planctomicrobium piriforme TaxID=1576369 RepID=A0A1I3MVN6_9PLAN|nr:hypothetical protein [Planctomicrobium piriforme]SFJ01174.1 hypothetical protein SAMN05421753_114127 [Planctomicrobium piriforme]